MQTLRANVLRAVYSYSTLNWITAIFMVLFHIGAIASLWFFSWTNVIVALALHWMAVGFGISLGYHRLHTHRGYKTSKSFEYFLAFCGTLTLEGGPLFWVATHRQHHQHSDKEGDPHTPRDGGFWAHVGWILFGDTHHNNTPLMSKYAPKVTCPVLYLQNLDDTFMTRDASLALFDQLGSTDKRIHAHPGNHGAIPDDDLTHVRELARRNEFAFAWQPGDIMMIDNLLVMHGRHAYTGPRQVLVAMT